MKFEAMGVANKGMEMDGFVKWQMCGKKKGFPTQSKANKTARKHGHRSYECPICFMWHVTSKEKK